jgi:hypothetical protein
MACQDTNTIIANGGQVIENLDGTVSVYMLGSFNTFYPSILTQQCCLALNPSYTFDINTQKCLWQTPTECSVDDVFKITLNPEGNSGSIFYVDEDENCNLKIEFDYLIKVKCESLNNLLTDSVNGLEDINPILYNSIVQLQLQIEEQTVICESLANQLTLINEQIENTPHSIFCLETNSNYCLTEPEGLFAWSQILTPNGYNLFIKGDDKPVICDNVQLIVDLNQQNLTSNPQGPLLIYECDVPFGSKAELISQQTSLLNEQLECQNILNQLNLTLQNLQNQASLILSTQCIDPIDFFENLDMSVTLDVVSGNNTTVVVYEDLEFFTPIGDGQLYQYLIDNVDSGFYVCGDPDCQPISLNLTGLEQENTTLCNAVRQSLIDSLFSQSNLQDVEGGVETFNNSLPNTVFASQWLTYSNTISDSEILDLIANQEIKFSIKINRTCSDVCVLIDNIKLIKECTSISERKIFVTKSPGFNLEKIIDNKKSWLNNNSLVNRDFDIRNLANTDIIRETNYDVEDDRLVINTKEIDLDVSLASAIETDVWCYLLDNPCLFTGITNCEPCGDDYKQFQDDPFFEFMDNNPYEFMDGNYGGVNLCCGDNLIQFDELVSTPLSSMTLFEDFKYFITSELIDAKNRQTISSYATLKALYDRYLNSYVYCNTNSAAFNYYTIEQFADLLGTYWVDIIEQVVPSTTIWGSVRVYSNTLFDQQKFKYKAYTSLLCRNPFFGDNVLSPINGTSGQSQNVEVSIVSLTSQNTGNTSVITSEPIVCNEIHIAQMNSGSEFIGTVGVVESTACSDGVVINECLMRVNVVYTDYTATALVESAALPLTYEWSNGDSGQTTTFSGAGQYQLVVTDANCCSVTIDFEIPVVYEACWYTLPDSQDFINSSFESFGTPFYNYTMQSLIVNGSELVVGPPPIYTLTSSNFETVSTPAGLTYTNFVTFLNQVFTTLGMNNYSAQLALNGQVGGSANNQGFYIIRPIGDTFSMEISETNSSDYFITHDDMFGVASYFTADCDNINIVNGVVIE